MFIAEISGFMLLLELFHVLQLEEMIKKRINWFGKKFFLQHKDFSHL